MKFTNTEEILLANTKAQRNLKRKELKKWYTEEELYALGFRNYPENRTPLPCDVKYAARFAEIKEAAAKHTPKLLHKWTPLEDKFLEASYMYLSDATIGLALNLPSYNVEMRRKVKKLFKTYTVNLEVVVWVDRERFDEDIKKEALTKARPDILQSLIQ